MADVEHLRILKSGVNPWNNWRESNKSIRPDLSYADLSGMKLDGINFENAYMRKIKGNSISLQNAKLKWAHLYSSSLVNANFYNTDLMLSTLCASNLSNARFIKSSLNVTDLSRTNLQDAIFDDIFLDRTDFSFSNLIK